jgi:hypothetical protein
MGQVKEEDWAQWRGLVSEQVESGKPDMIEGFNDDEIRSNQSVGRCRLKTARRCAEAEAIEQARERLAQAGLTSADVARVRMKAAEGLSYKGGHTYQHPADKALVWNAKGQKPKWLRELEVSGGTAVEMTANDNAPPMTKKMV